MSEKRKLEEESFTSNKSAKVDNPCLGEECVITSIPFTEENIDQAVYIDNQCYNRNALVDWLRRSLTIPHSRRYLTQEDIDQWNLPIELPSDEEEEREGEEEEEQEQEEEEEEEEIVPDPTEEELRAAEEERQAALDRELEEYEMWRKSYLKKIQEGPAEREFRDSLPEIPSRNERRQGGIIDFDSAVASNSNSNNRYIRETIETGNFPSEFNPRSQRNTELIVARFHWERDNPHWRYRLNSADAGRWEEENEKINKEALEKYGNNGYMPFKKKGGKWSRKYKRSINCKRPKGFSQKQYCKYGRTKKRTSKRSRRSRRTRRTSRTRR